MKSNFSFSTPFLTSLFDFYLLLSVLFFESLEGLIAHSKWIHFFCSDSFYWNCCYLSRNSKLILSGPSNIIKFFSVRNKSRVDIMSALCIDRSQIWCSIFLTRNHVEGRMVVEYRRYTLKQSNAFDLRPCDSFSFRGVSTHCCEGGAVTCYD